jgi:hypothetical protein
MKKPSTKTVGEDMPELKRAELGKGVRGKIRPAFQAWQQRGGATAGVSEGIPSSEAVNQALASLLALAQEAKDLTSGSGRSSRRRHPVWGLLALSGRSTAFRQSNWVSMFW